MRRTTQRRVGPLATAAAAILAFAAADPRASPRGARAQSTPPSAVQPQFFPDDPVWVDDDRAFDASGAKPVATGDIYDFAQQTFLGPGQRVDLRAPNVNTLDEVPDSSWFTNRIGRRAMSREEIVRGPDRRPRPVVDDWPIVAGKSEGRQPGYRVQDADGHLWQIEFDPPSNPEMASAAEVIGTAVYHALGYNVVEVYVTDIDPERLTISPKATVRSATTPGGRRPYTKADVADVLARAARRPDGRYRVLASRFADGSPLGSFRYDGQRPDDPNDVFPHEHRRELRGNRVFAAWLNHDDSRGLNSLDMLEKGDGGKAAVRHYMFDFGSIMGSGTVFAEKARGGHEYIVDMQGALLTGLTLGLYPKPWITIRYPKVPPSVGRFEGTRFRPDAWKAEYPNPAFDNMRADDAFWAARLVARFTADDIAALVAKGEYSDPSAAAYVTQVLVERRRKVLATWLNGVTPLVDGSIAEGRFQASNAAVDAGVTEPPRRYVARWFAWDNATGTQRALGDPVELAGSAAVSLALPEALASPGAGEYIGITVTGDHPAHPGWAAHPVTFSFRRTAGGWEAVGISRERRQEDPR